MRHQHQCEPFVRDSMEDNKNRQMHRIDSQFSKKCQHHDNEHHQQDTRDVAWFRKIELFSYFKNPFLIFQMHLLVIFYQIDSQLLLTENTKKIILTNL